MKLLKSMEIVVHSNKSVSTKVSKEIVPFQQEFPTEEFDVKSYPIRHPKSEKKIRLRVLLGIRLLTTLTSQPCFEGPKRFIKFFQRSLKIQ